MPSRMTASLYAANARYQPSSGTLLPEAGAVGVDQLVELRVAGGRVDRAGRDAAAALDPADVPVEAEHAQVDRRVAERRHLPVEDRRDARAAPVDGPRARCPAGSRRARCCCAGWSGRARRAGPAGRRGPAPAASASRRAGVRQRRSWRSRYPSARPRSVSPTVVGVDRVELGEQGGQLEAHGAQLVGGVRGVLRRVGEHGALDEVHDVEDAARAAPSGRRPGRRPAGPAREIPAAPR